MLFVTDLNVHWVWKYTKFNALVKTRLIQNDFLEKSNSWKVINKLVNKCKYSCLEFVWIII